MFSKLALRLLQRLFTKSASTPTDIKTVLDSNTAVAITEACMAAGMATASTDWQLENTLNKYTLEEARGALSTAIGLSLSGVRATTFLTSPELMTAQDLLVTAVGRHVPLVIHLTNQTLSAHAGALGSGHKTYHASSDLGCFVLQATTVQEAVDFSLIARRVAELTLIPGLVAMDNEQLSIQEVCLPSPELIHKFLGDPNEQITSPTPAQQLLFGETRRRIPRWFDPDQPVMHGAIQGPDSWALGAVAKHPYFSHHLEAILEQSFALLAKYTGRQLGPISSYKTDDAKIVLVAQGSSIETLETVADYMRTNRKLKVGVLGIRNFRPFLGSKIAEKLKNKQVVAVLERVDTPLAEDPPLMRQVRAALERASENNRLGTNTYPNYPTIKKLPRFRSVVYGLGGYPLRVSDLIELCDTIDTKGQGRIFLGFEFERSSSIYPKRQILLDNLHRQYPNIAGLGLKSQQPTPNLAPKDAITIAIHSVSANKLNLETASLLHSLHNGWIRSRSGLFKSWSGWMDIFTYSSTELKDLGDDLAIDIAVLTKPNKLNQSIPRLSKDGLVLVVSNETWHLTQNIQQAKVYHIATTTQPAILGGLFGMLIDSGKLSVTTRKILTLYETSLQHELSENKLAISLEQFKTGLETVTKIDCQTPILPTNTWNDEAPLAVRHLGGSEDNYSSLPRFWDQVGVLYRNNEVEELTPDPYLTTGTIPPLTSTFHDLSIGRQMLPAFNPDNCTGCGQCWTSCPESAIGSIVISPTALLNAGIKLASADVLQMITSKLAANIHKLGRDTEANYSNIGLLLQIAFADLIDKLPFDAERKQAISDAITELVNNIGELPIARTEAFFYEAERFQHDSGELLSIVVNSDACKACGLCIEACEPEALAAKPQVKPDNKLWRLWEQLPDTAGTSIEHAKIGSMPAILLSRYCQLAIAGGDNAEAGSGEKLAVRLALGVTEFQRQPLVNDSIKKIVELRTKITTEIKNTLANALPSDDLEALAASLNTINPKQAPLSTLTKQIENSLDANRLSRLVKVSQDLNKLYWQLTEGKHGLGRSRFSLAIAPGTLTDWAGHWPDNPFQVPVAIDMNGDTANLAIGLLAGQMQKAIEGVALLRQAQLELKKPEEASRVAKLAIIPEWDELTQVEQKFCPPLLLLGNDKVLVSKTALNQLLSLNLPIKVILFTDLAIDTRRLEPGLLALAQSKAYVVQTSISHTEHFLNGIKAALEFSGPALIYIYTPSPERHGFSPEQTIARANAAVNSRMFPLFEYNPNAEGVFGSRISLEGNPEPEQTWVVQEAESITPADWAINEQRFASYFVPNNASYVSVADYIVNNGKTAFVTKGDERFQIRPEFLAICKERMQIWQTLQELAGLVTPFTAAVETRLTQKIADQHQAELDDLKLEYEAKIQKLQTEMEADMAARVKNNLLSLAGYE